MLIQTRTIIVKAGHTEEVIERFSQPGGPMTKIPGFIDLSVAVKKLRKRDAEEEEVLILVRWESEEAWKAWEKSPEHIAGHRNKNSQEKPDYLISTTVNMYEVKTVKHPT
ncbi:antibiotic biosynthesis monooxygenase family protein [Paenibacillus senegalensis]|uniref:antibiotic biosynthesis monooxygenase family protein n=1 Tax=Paenibacillus senegalensis TaxID=1465766 RepID=UPI000289543E|nr:antibiotic biosynthesis monooxygenase [Paenibacillus senegalensis]